MTAGLDFSFLSPVSTPARSSRNTTSMTMNSDLAFSGNRSVIFRVNGVCQKSTLNASNAMYDSVIKGVSTEH